MADDSAAGRGERRPASRRVRPARRGAEAPAEVEDVHPDTSLAAERLADLQRLQAEYVNYSKRVDRDREVARDMAVGSVVEALLRCSTTSTWPASTATSRAARSRRSPTSWRACCPSFGVERFGEPGEAFDPSIHEALMHVEAELAEGTDGDHRRPGAPARLPDRRAASMRAARVVGCRPAVAPSESMACRVLRHPARASPA